VKGREGDGIPGGRGGDAGAEVERREQRAAAAVEMGRGKTARVGATPYMGGGVA